MTINFDRESASKTRESYEGRKEWTKHKMEWMRVGVEGGERKN